MKKFNSFLARFMLVLLALHGLMGLYASPPDRIQLEAPFLYPSCGPPSSRHTGYSFVKDAVREGMRTGRWYLKENASFWLIRLSGFIILLSVWFHITAYTTTVNGVFSFVNSRLSVSFHKSFSSPPFLFIFCAPRSHG